MPKSLDKSGMSKDILRSLMDPFQPAVASWSASDLRSILEHQLASTLLSEADKLAELSQSSRKAVLAVLDSCGCKTFFDVLTKVPSGAALRILKDYAKGSMAEDGGLPRDVARVIYVAAILRSRQAGIAEMTSLSDASIEREARRCLTFGWLPDSARKLLGVAIK